MDSCSGGRELSSTAPSFSIIKSGELIGKRLARGVMIEVKEESRLCAELLEEMFISDTDCSDNDRDFDISETPSKGHCSSFCRSPSQSSSQSSEDTEEPDECVPHKRQAKRRKRVKPSKGTKAAKTPKLSSPVVTSLPDVPGTPTPGNESRLYAELLEEMFISDTDCSDNDRDFDISETPSKGHCSLFCRTQSKSSSQSSEDTEEPDECVPHKRQAKRRKRVKPSKGTKAAKTPKLSSPVVTSLPDVPGTPTPGNNAVLPPGTEVTQTPGNKEIRTPGNGAVVANGSKATELPRPVNRAEERSPASVPSPNVPQARAKKGLRPNPKRKTQFSPPHRSMPSFTPPVVHIPDMFAEWNKDTIVIRPAWEPGKEKYYCCVEGCRSGTASDKEHGLWLFPLPENEQLMSTWNERLPIDYELNRPQSPRICFRHFDKRDFVQRKQRLIGLKHDALPKETDSLFWKEPPF